MACLIDTGVLLRAFDPNSPDYREVRRALRSLWASNEALFVTFQNIAEFWNVATRPVNRNGYGISTERAAKRIARIERMCGVLIEDIRSFEAWKQLVSAQSLVGVSVHDALGRGYANTQYCKDSDTQ